MSLSVREPTGGPFVNKQNYRWVVKSSVHLPLCHFTSPKGHNLFLYSRFAQQKWKVQNKKLRGVQIFSPKTNHIPIRK